MKKKIALLSLISALAIGASLGFTACGEEDVAEHDHVYDGGTVTTAPTCYKEGVRTYYCTVEGCEQTKTTPVEMIAHTWNDGAVTTAPTCFKEGVRTYTCTVDGCGKKKEEGVEKIAHSWDDGVVTKEATCNADGVTTYTCTVVGCGNTKKESITERPSHSFGDEAVWVKIDEEYHAKQCTVEGCGALDTEKIMHTWVDLEITKPATNDEAGEKKVKCSECEYESTQVIPALNHKKGTDYGKDENGHWLKCSEHPDCGVKFEEAPHAHSTENAEKRIDATCHSDGVKYMSCECGHETTEAITERPDHDFTGEWKNDSDRGHYHICQNAGCGATDTPVVHAWENKEVIKEPTNDYEGERKVECSVCHREETRIIPALNHTQGSEYGHDENGHWFKCSAHTDCGVKFEEALHAHSTENTDKRVDATCHSDGIKYMVCECGHETTEAITERPSHNFTGEWKIGTNGHYKECENCEAVSDEVGHIHNTENVDKRIDATCHSDGIKYMVCECGHEITEALTDRPAHTFGEESVWAKVDETHHAKQCTVEGCDAVDIESKAEHIWNEGEVTTASTFWAEGVKTYTCSDCDGKKNESVARLDSVRANIDDEDWKFGVADYHFNPDSFEFKQITAKNEDNDGYKDGTEIKNNWFAGENFDTFICIAYTFKEAVEADISIYFKGIGGDDKILSDYSVRIAYNETPEWGDRGTEYTVEKTHSFNAGDTVYFIFKHEENGWDQGNYSITINRKAEIQA